MFPALLVAALLSQGATVDQPAAAAAPVTLPTPVNDDAAAVPPDRCDLPEPFVRLHADELSAGLGVIGQGYTFNGGRFGDLLVGGIVEGRLVWGSGFTVDGSLLVPVPTAGDGASGGFGVLARIGWTGERWSVVSGPSFQFVGRARPDGQWLPSLRATYLFSGWGLSAGLFDFYATVPAHLTLELGDFGVGYVAPIGALATARFRVGRSLGLKVGAMAFRLFNTEVAMVTVTASWGRSWGRGAP
ncbi:MAG: hypothetical protein ACYC8T_04140 [Myxococcaceae bacterium]